MTQTAVQEGAEPVVRENSKRNRFEIVLGDRVAGVITYRKDTAADGQPMTVLEHTRVKSDFEGQGLASKLAREALTQLRDSGSARVRVECPFICSWIGRNPDFVDDLELDPHADSEYTWQDD